MEHAMLPHKAQRSGTGQSLLLSNAESADNRVAAYNLPNENIDYPMAADIAKTYAASENIDALITKAKADMERAAKSLDFLAAARYRDRMYELQKLKDERK